MTKTTGEGKLLSRQLKDISQDILTKIMEIQEQLADLQLYASKSNPFDRQEIVNRIADIRYRIGAIQHAQSHHIEEEGILYNIAKKLDVLLDIVIGEKK